MAEVILNEGESLESALRRFKRKVQQEDIIKDVKKHSFYLKPGEKKRIKQALARKRLRKKMRGMRYVVGQAGMMVTRATCRRLPSAGGYSLSFCGIFGRKGYHLFYPKLPVYSKIKETVDLIRTRCRQQPALGLILGSGLGAYADSFQDRTVIPFSDLPSFPFFHGSWTFGQPDYRKS